MRTPMHSMRLSNGIRVVLVPHADTAAATVFVLYGVGSRYETGRMNGASHYIEHMMFKGTRKRPDTLAISRDLDAAGADYNAFTGKDHTGYYVKLPSERLPLAIDMLEDILYHSAYRQTDLDSERKVILEEIRMYEDNPMMLVDELMEEALFGNSPLARPIAGTERSMNGIDRRDLLAYRDAHYLPENTVIAVAGNFDGQQVVGRLERAFGGKRGKGRRRRFTRFDAGRSRSGAKIVVRQKETEQVQVSFGFLGYAQTDRRLPALTVMSTILGGTMSSRLFTAVRERLGLCYFIRSSASPYQDTGVLDVQAGVARTGVDKAFGAIMKELKRMRERNVTVEELARAKAYIEGKLVLGLEDSSRLAEWYAKQELLTGRIEDPTKKLGRVMRVTADDVRAVARDVIRPGRLALAVIGPEGRSERYEKLISL